MRREGHDKASASDGMRTCWFEIPSFHRWWMSQFVFIGFLQLITMCLELWLIQVGVSANIYVKTDILLILISFVFFHMVPQQRCWLSVTFACFLSQPPKSLWKRERQQDLRAHSAISSRSLTSHLPSAVYYSPLICYRCLIQSHVKCILYAGSSQNSTDGKTIGWWEKKNYYNFWVWGCSSISGPASSVH